MTLKTHLFTTLALLAFATPAFSGAASDAFEACENIALDAATFTQKVQQAGFSPLAADDTEAFKSVFVDGAIIASATPQQLAFDWEGSLLGAAELANILIERRGQTDSLGVFYNQAIKATLVRLDQTIPGQPRIHCLFSGPSDAEMVNLFETLAEMDAKAGLTMSPPEFQLSVISTTSGGQTSDAQIARYTDVARATLGRDPATEMAFSLIVLLTSE
jgi:hypothetical protein